jgi:hypothetical protein
MVAAMLRMDKRELCCGDSVELVGYCSSRRHSWGFAVVVVVGRKRLCFCLGSSPASLHLFIPRAQQLAPLTRQCRTQSAVNTRLSSRLHADLMHNNS